MEYFSNDNDIPQRQYSDDIYSVSERCYNSDNLSSDEDRVYNLNELENHIVVGTRASYSSTDSQKIKLDEINFEYNNNEVVTTSFYNCEDLNKLKFTDIYNILSSSQMIIFIDNYKLLKEHNCTYRHIRRKLDFIKEEFPDVLFYHLNT